MVSNVNKQTSVVEKIGAQYRLTDGGTDELLEAVAATIQNDWQANGSPGWDAAAVGGGQVRPGFV